MSNRSGSAKTAPSLKTKTQPEGERDGYYEGPDPITSLHIIGSAHLIDLPPRKTCTLGSSPKCDIVINAPYISKQHCMLERLYDGLRIVDQSKNGTWIDHRPANKEPKDVRAGGTFVAGRITFLALNREMTEAFPTLSDILDWEDEDPFRPADRGWVMPSNAIMWAAGTDNLLIFGPRGCDQRRLAETIHAISPMRSRALVRVDSIPTDRAGQKDLLLRSQKTTLLLALDDKAPVMDASFRSMLFSPAYRVRVVAWAPTFDHAQKVLGTAEVARMRRIELRPLAFRTEQIARLLDRQLAASESSLRFEQLTEANRDALLKAEWRRNLDDLRTAARRLAAVHRAPSLRKAALALDIKNFNVLQDWFSKTMKLSLPLTADT